MLRAITLAGVALAYNRTVSYVGQQVLSCKFDNQAIVDALDNKLGLDIWDLKSGSSWCPHTPKCEVR